MTLGAMSLRYVMAFVRPLFASLLSFLFYKVNSDTASRIEGVVIEMILTAYLVFTIFMLAAEKHTGNFIAPVGIGLSLFTSELTGQF